MTNHFTINCRGQLIPTDKPLVMGILNVTPDSFFDGGKYNTNDQIRARANQILNQGADIIDLGAYSTRPGATNISPDDEWRRLDNALHIIRSEHPDAIISIDTFRGQIARNAVTQYHADIINDISAFDLDPQMLPAIIDLHVPYILTHIQGNPQSMQLNPTYTSRVTQHVIHTLSAKINTLTANGVADIIIDPGFGFGKTLDQNYQLLADLQQLHTLNRPVLVGLSRKSMIYKLIDTTPADSLTGTTVLNTLALLAGAHILRVHDVLPCVQTIKILNQLKTNS